MNFVCVLKSGGDYSANHVLILEKMVKRNTTKDINFVCLTDINIPNIKCIPLQCNLPGKYSMWEAFRVKGPTVVTGIDTVFVDNIDNLFDLAEDCKSDEFYLMKAFSSRRELANGIMVWNGNWEHLLTDYPYDEKIIRKYKLEMNYTIDKLKKEKVKIKTVNKYVKGIYSYKWDCKDGKPKDASIVVFHGKPRPHEARSQWVKDYYVV